MGPPDDVASLCVAHGVGRSSRNVRTPTTHTDSSTTVTVVLKMTTAYSDIEVKPDSHHAIDPDKIPLQLFHEVT